MPILLKIINKEQAFSIFIVDDAKHTILLKVLNIINNKDIPSSPVV
jgi:hypothetical protein